MTRKRVRFVFTVLNIAASVTIVLLVILASLTDAEHASFIEGIRLGIIGAASLIVILSVWQMSARNSTSRRKQPLLSISNSRTELHLRDKDGRLAIVKKTQEFTASRADVKVIIDKGMRADGSIRILKWQCDGLHVRVEPTQFSPSSSPSELRFLFDESPIPNKRYTRLIEYELLDSFLQRQEYFAIRITRDVDNLTLLIRAPSERPFHAAWLQYTEQSTVIRQTLEECPHLVLTGEGDTELVYCLKRPVVGSMHEVWWEW